MKYLDRKGVIKTIYSLMMTDGTILDTESKQFEEIGSEIDPEGFVSYKDAIISECTEKLSDAINDPDYYDILQEYIDSLVVDVISVDVVTPRYVIWNLFAVAYNEEHIDQEELRLIRHVSRTLEMSKTDYLELEQYMKTVIDLRRKKTMLESSTKSYSEIRPMVEEIELRQKTIVESVTSLMCDEAYEYQQKLKMHNTEDESQIKQKFDVVASKTSETAEKVATNVKTTFNDKVAPAASELGKGIKKGFSATTRTIGKTGSSLFQKLKNKDSKEGQ